MENGTLIQGVVSKDTVGNKAGSLGHIVALEQVSASVCACLCVSVSVLPLPSSAPVCAPAGPRCLKRLLQLHTDGG